MDSSRICSKEDEGIDFLKYFWSDKQYILKIIRLWLDHSLYTRAKFKDLKWLIISDNKTNKKNESLFIERRTYDDKNLIISKVS